MAGFNDPEGKAKVEAECEKRNKHKGRSLSHMAWKPLWTPKKGWHPEFRPAVQVERVEKKELIK